MIKDNVQHQRQDQNLIVYPYVDTNKKITVLKLRPLVASYKNIIKDAIFIMLFANVSNLYFK